jgi:YgiT-type zinc finger domain-containing protein
MTCPICKHGEIAPGHTTIAIQRGESTIIHKSVPAGICDNCEEYNLSEEVALKVYAMADAAVRSGAKVEILRFAA